MPNTDGWFRAPAGQDLGSFEFYQGSPDLLAVYPEFCGYLKSPQAVRSMAGNSGEKFLYFGILLLGAAE